MKSRQNFEGELQAVIKSRLVQSQNMREEALFMVDTLLAASFFLVGVLEKKPSVERSMNCLFTRAQIVREAMARAERNNPKAGDGTATGIDGDPIIITP
jgi:hypothetical protein